MPSLANVPALAGVLILLWIVKTIIYNLFLHPLAKYPGSLLAKLTGWYEWYGAADGFHHVWLYHMHQKYGPVVRVAPNRLSYTTLDACKSIYIDRRANNEKAGWTEAITLLKGGSRNIQTLKEEPHLGRRRLIGNAFTMQAITGNEVHILKCIRQWSQILRAKATDTASWTGSLDMRQWFDFLTEDILGELLLSEEFGKCQQGESDSHGVGVGVAQQAQVLGWMPLSDFSFNLLKRVAQYARQHEWKWIQPTLYFDRLMQQLIERRLARDDQSRKDLFYYIMQAKDPESGDTITTREIELEVGTLFGAGQDTTAATMSAMLFYLTSYPETLEKLVAEIRSTFSDVEEIRSGEKLSSMTYLEACISETIRFSPAVPGPMLRQISKGGMTIGGEYVPAGTQVSVPAYAIQHDEAFYPNSWIWKPERWLGDKREANPDAIVAFSLGNRLCLGKRLAYFEISLAISTLLFLFDVKRAPESTTTLGTGGTPEYIFKDWFTTDRRGPIMQLRPRI